MPRSWDDLTYHQKFEILRADISSLHTALNALTSELDATWDAMRETRLALGKIDKEVATIRSLSPHLSPRKYSKTA